jgi:hypothetical protein
LEPQRIRVYEMEFVEEVKKPVPKPLSKPMSVESKKVKETKSKKTSE